MRLKRSIEACISHDSSICPPVRHEVSKGSCYLISPVLWDTSKLNANMKRLLVVAVKVLSALVLWLAVAELISGTDFAPFVGTLVLAATAAGVLMFTHQLRLRVVAAIFLVAVVGVSHAVDSYFWWGVWNHGLPWPFPESSPSGSAFIGSVSQFIYQVSVVSFSILSVVALGLTTWYLAYPIWTPPQRQEADR